MHLEVLNHFSLKTFLPYNISPPTILLKRHFSLIFSLNETFLPKRRNREENKIELILDSQSNVTNTLVNLSNFQVAKLPKFNVQCLWNCHKWLFWTVWIRQNVISRKIGVAVKSSNFQALTSHFESFWSIVHSVEMRTKTWWRLLWDHFFRPVE